MNDLNDLISIIESQFENINDCWINSENYFSLNMKRKKVIDVYNDEKLLLYVFNYREFIKDNISNVIEAIQANAFSNVVNTRVKAINSIQYKIQNYALYREEGKIPLKKCLNDIFGIRIILKDDVNFMMISKRIESNFPTLKCIEAKRGDYYAVHIYFGNDDNYKFQWELQVWDKKHEKINLESHSKYKQDYTKWEQNKF